MPSVGSTKKKAYPLSYIIFAAMMIPLFPLKLVVYPGEQLNLHIFEPRYKQLINDCRSEKMTFAIPPYINETIMPIAPEMIMQRVVKVYPDGKMDIKTMGKGLLLTEEFKKTMSGKLYGGALAKPIPLEMQGNLAKNIEIIDLIRRLHKLMDVSKSLPEKTDRGISYHIAHHVGLNIQQEYELLEMTDEEQRQDYLIEHITKLIPIVTEMNALRVKVQMNGHFKNLLPPDL